MKQTIQHINHTIQHELHAYDVKAYQLAESVAMRSDEEVTIPVLIMPSGECINVYGDTDKHHITLYHRLSNISYQKDDNASFGNRSAYTEEADMSLIVFGKREVISQFDMERIARSVIASQTNCTLVGSDFNALQIFASEYAGVTYFMGSAYFLFKINYRITSTCNNGCN